MSLGSKDSPFAQQSPFIITSAHSMIWDIVTAWVCDAPHRLVCSLVPRGGCYFGWLWEPQEVRPHWKKPVIGGMPREMGFVSRLFVGFSQLLCPHEVSRPLSHAPVLWCSVLLQAQNNGLFFPQQQRSNWSRYQLFTFSLSSNNAGFRLLLIPHRQRLGYAADWLRGATQTMGEAGSW